jgi:hypothetical protein
MFKELSLLTVTLNVPTRQLAASSEVQVLHAHGKVQLGDIPCVVDVRKGKGE